MQLDGVQYGNRSTHEGPPKLTADYLAVTVQPGKADIHGFAEFGYRTVINNRLMARSPDSYPRPRAKRANMTDVHLPAKTGTARIFLCGGAGSIARRALQPRW